MKRKILAGVLALTLLAATGCTAEDDTDEVKLIKNSGGGIICYGTPPGDMPVSSRPVESSPDDTEDSQPMMARAIEGLSVRGNPIPTDAESITIQISNPTDQEMTFGENYWLEKQDNGGTWKKLEYLPDAAWNDIAKIIQPHSTGEHRITPAYFYGEDALQPGHYRYGNKFNGETLYAEFDMAEPGDKSAPDNDVENAEKELENALGGLQKRGPDDAGSRPEPSKYVQQLP